MVTAAPIKTKHRIIAIEEHYSDQAISFMGGRPGAITDRLKDIGDWRLREMDEAGIDVQVLSMAGGALYQMPADEAVPLARSINDRLHAAVSARPDRFAAFAALPCTDPKAAADELERVVTKYGFKGAMTHGLSQGMFLDDKRFWPIWERAAALDVPIYMHPSEPHKTVIDVYYKDYLKTFPGIISAPLGYTVETAVQGVRMVLSGVFEAYPNLKIILGHMGEALPFLLWRIDHTLKNPGNAPIEFREIFCKHFWITTSGFFSDPALICSMLELGADRIIFSVDWPWGNNKQGVDWLDHMSISAEDKAKIYHGNVEKLLRMERNA
jgi:predicted TIM-barrel fold metal-dependent hydrolase